MAKESRLVLEIRRLLLLENLLDLFRNRSTTLDDLRAVERLLKSRKGKQRRGAPALYSDESLADVQLKVRQKMARLRAAGKRRAGPKTAIRSLVEGLVRETEGSQGLVTREGWIRSYVARVFKIYEAARKRG